MTVTAKYEGSQLAQNGFPLSNMIASDANGLEFLPGGDDVPRIAEATVTHYPVESDDILWSGVEVDLEMQNIGDATPAQLILGLYGITCHGDINLLGENVINSIPTSLTDKTVNFDLLRSACEASLTADKNQTTAGKIQLNLPYRTNYYESLLLNYGAYSGWKRYKQVPIICDYSTTSRGGSAPIFISVPYDSDMNADFSDIRFLDKNGNELTHAIWSKTDSSTAIFCVWMNDFPLKGTPENLYIRYKNSSATSAAVPLSNLLVMYDPLDNSSIDAAWTGGGIGGWSETTSLINIFSTVDARWTNGVAKGPRIRRPYSSITESNWMMTVLLKYSSMPANTAKGLFLENSANNSFIRIERYNSAGTMKIGVLTSVAGAAESLLASVNDSSNVDLWFRIRRWGASWYFEYSKTGLPGSFTMLYYTTNINFTPNYIGMHARNWLYNSSYNPLNSYFNNFIVQKIGTGTEPYFGTLSEEKQGEYGGTWTWQQAAVDALIEDATYATFTTPALSDVNALAYITSKEYERYANYDSPKVRINDKTNLTLGYNGLDCYDALRLKVWSNCNADYAYNIPEVRFKYEL